MIRTLIIAAGLAAAGTANAAFVGGTMRVDASGSAAASALFGTPTTVVNMYVAFTEADDILNTIGMANFSTTSGANLVQNGLFGAVANTDSDVNDAAFGAFPETEWDSYVGIGGPLFGNSNAQTDPDFAFTPNGVVGGWFDIPQDDGMGGVSRTGLAGNGIMENGLFLVWAGQFVVDDASGTRSSDIGNGFIASDIFAGALDVNWIDALGGPNIAESQILVGVPAPGAAALFGLAGLTASRRRRG